MKEMAAPEISSLPQIRLKIVRRSSHPWIFQKMVEKPATRLPPGSVVDIVDRDGQWVGRGFWNGHSRIALRVLSSDPTETIDTAFFARRLEQALSLRRTWLGLDAITDAYRLVHSEGDQLSGLVVDRFGSTLVLEFFVLLSPFFMQWVVDDVLVSAGTVCAAQHIRSRRHTPRPRMLGRG